jgi:hypothetical protein
MSLCFEVEHSSILTRAALAFGALLGWSCAPEPAACEVGVARAALMNGAERAVYLKLAPAQEQAVVEVLVRAGPALEEHCSGVVVATGVVLTAKHCAHELDAVQATVRFSSVDDDSRLEAAATVAGMHPDLDLMVLTLDEQVEPLATMTPLSIGAGTPAALRPGSLVQTAGYGLGADGVLGKRAFLVEVVRELDEQEITVDAAALGGACFGDSGGPLLVRDDDGIARAFGILAFGANDCFGRDRYTRIGDDVATWIHEITGVDPRTSAVPEAAVEALGHEGRCFGDQAVWAQSETVRSKLCAPARACGWSDEANGFRCVDSTRDPCQGVSDLGTCRDGAATRCVHGRLQENPCSACGFDCVRSPRTGASICLSSQAL